MVLAFDALAAVNLLFLCIVAACLFVGLIVVPALDDRARREAAARDIPPAFRIYDDGE